jgi:hypothetical protein
LACMTRAYKVPVAPLVIRSMMAMRSLRMIFLFSTHSLLPIIGAPR